MWLLAGVCVSVIKAHRAVARRGAQVSRCDSDVIEGCRFSVQLHVLPDSQLALHRGHRELT